MCGGGKNTTQEIKLPAPEPLPAPLPMPEPSAPSQSAPSPSQTESQRASRINSLKKGMLSTIKAPRDRQQAKPALVSQAATMYDSGKKTLG